MTNEGATINAADASGLATLTGFHPASHTLNVSDTASNITTYASQLFAQGFTRIQATSGTLSGNTTELLDSTLHFSAGAHAMLASSATVSVATAAALAALPGFSIASGVSISVADTAANLAVLQPSVTALAAAEVITAPATVSAAIAAALTALPHLSLGSNALIVSDTLQGLLGLPARAAELATSLVLNADSTASAAQIAAFATLPHVSLGGYTIAVSDSAAKLLTLSGTALTDASSLTLSQDAMLTAASFTVLRALPNLSTGGHAVTIVDSAANLAALSGSFPLASAIDLSSNATVNAGQIAALYALPGFSLAGNVLSLSDIAMHLLALPPAALALAGSVTLSADATMSAAQAEALFSEPNFSAGAHQLVVADTAANLLSLPHTLQLAVTTLALSASQSVTAAALTQLAGLGIKFSEAGNVLICADTAANLSTFQTSAAALASAEVITTPALVSAATAVTLSELAHLSLGADATLTVQDSVSNLIALGSGAPASTGTVRLAPGSIVTINAAQGQALGSIPHFSPAGASIIVADTVANLTSPANNGWQVVAANTNVVDTAAALAAAASTPLAQAAAAVTLSSNGQVSAAVAAQIANIPHFSCGSFGLTVIDRASDIAAHADAVIQVATAAVVTDSGPITATVADELAAVSQAGLLTFQGGGQLAVQDSFSALTSPSNSAGLLLAARIDVLDTAANLAIASAHDWGGVNPSYTLSQPAVITAAVATSLASLGGHFSTAGNALSVADTAANVVSAASALASLHVAAVVSDSTANLGTREIQLLSLGATLGAVHVTDNSSVTAAVAAGISGLAAKLGTPVLAVSDSAAHVDTSLSGLVALGTNVTIAVTDTACAIAMVSTDLATLHGVLSITLTDTMPVTATVAAGLSPVAENLANGTSISIADTGATVAYNAAALLALGEHVGTVVLSDGTTQSAADAGALAALDGHLAHGVTLTITGSGADVTANEENLTKLAADHRLAAVVVTGTSVSDALVNATALNALPSQVSISDSAADVTASLSSLANITGLTAITLTDVGTPVLSMNIETLGADAAVLTKINSPFSITIVDSAVDISADLAAGTSSVIAAHLAHIGGITVDDGSPVALTQAQILAAGVDDGAGSTLSKFSGLVNVTGVDVAHLAEVAGLGRSPAVITLTDTGAAISADLAQGNASVLLGQLGVLTAINVADHAAVTLTASQVLVAGVDDGAASAIGLLHGAALSVTGATIAQLTALAGLHVPATTVTVSDTAAHLSADLASGSSLLAAGLPAISAIIVEDGQTITLDEQQLMAVHVDDGAGSVLSGLTGGSLAVTGVLAADLATVLRLGVVPTSISITDSATHLANSLSDVEANIGSVTSISVTGGPLVLTAGEALAAHVDDGPGSVVDRLIGHLFDVTDASVAQLGHLTALPYGPASVSVTDSSSALVSDLLSDTSLLAANAGVIGIIAVSNGTLVLTDAQAQIVLNTPGLNAVMAKLAPATAISVIGASVADLASVADAGWPHVSIAVSDTPTAIAADLATGTPSLTQHAAVLSRLQTHNQ